MKTRLFLVCCAALALGSGCATYDSGGGTGDDTTVVSGSGYREFYYAAPEHREYTWKEPWIAPSGYRESNYPHKDYFGAHAPATVWKQPSPNGQDWIDARPEFLWYRGR